MAKVGHGIRGLAVYACKSDMRCCGNYWNASVSFQQININQSIYILHVIIYIQLYCTYNYIIIYIYEYIIYVIVLYIQLYYVYNYVIYIINMSVSTACAVVVTYWRASWSISTGWLSSMENDKEGIRWAGQVRNRTKGYKCYYHSLICLKFFWPATEVTSLVMATASN